MSWISSFWNMNCPRCRKGKLFIEPFEITKPLDMHRNCSVCNQRIEPEPGFYFGAMFLSYIFSAWYLLIPTLLLVFYFKWSVGSAIGLIIFIAAISYLKILRLSRSLWIHINVKYNPTLSKSTSSS